MTAFLKLETARLRFRRWRDDDFAAFAGFFADQQQAKYVGGKKSPESAWRLMATYIGHFELRGFGYLPLETKQSGQWVGTVGLWKSDPWPETELGYWLLPSAQGEGFASEAAKAVLTYAFETLQLSTVVSYIDGANVASIKLAERLGGRHDGELELLEFGPHQIYRYNARSVPR